MIFILEILEYLICGFLKNKFNSIMNINLINLYWNDIYIN